jgi:hypothetical protein
MGPGYNTMIAILALAGMFCCVYLFFGHQHIVCANSALNPNWQAQFCRRTKLNRSDVWSDDTFAAIEDLLSIIYSLQYISSFACSANSLTPSLEV